MKKKIFFLLVCSLIAFSSQAQLRFGVKGGVNLTGVSFNDGSFIDKNVTGYQIGPTIEWLIHGNLGFDGAVVYSQKGIKFENGQNTSESKNGYIDIPVNLKYRLGLSENFKPFVAAGPYVSFRVSGDDNFNTIIDGISNQWESQNFGAGLNFGAGVELFKFLQVGANYGLGLTDNYKASNGDYTTQDRTWSITAAIYF